MLGKGSVGGDAEYRYIYAGYGGLSRHQSFLIPGLHLRYPINPTSVLLAAYRYDVDDTNLTNFLPDTLQTSYQRRVRGLAAPVYFRKHTAFGALSQHDLFTNRSWGVSALATYANGSLLPQLNLQSYSTVSTLSPTDKGVWFANVTANVAQLINPLSLVCKVEVAYNLSTRYWQINASDQFISSSAMAYRVELNTAFSGPVSADVSARYLLNQTTTIGVSRQHNTAYTLLLDQKITVKPIAGLRFQFRGQQVFNRQQGVMVAGNAFFDVNATFKAPKSRVSFSVDCRNLLNQQQIDIQGVSEFSTTLLRTDLLGRWILGGVQFQF